MLTCPRCGNEAEYLADEVFSLVRCEFCGEDIDAADLALQAEIDRIPRVLPPVSSDAPRPLVEAASASRTDGTVASSDRLVAGQPLIMPGCARS